MSAHLSGPWSAYIAEDDGFVYDSIDDVRENAEDPEGEFTIVIVRGSALPDDRSGIRLRLPGSCMVGDTAHEMDDVYLDEEDASVGLEARWAQAQAMAAGLNAAVTL